MSSPVFDSSSQPERRVEMQVDTNVQNVFIYTHICTHAIQGVASSKQGDGESEGGCPGLRGSPRDALWLSRYQTNYADF